MKLILTAILALFLTACTQTSPVGLVGQEKLRKAKKPIPDQYIVVLNDYEDSNTKSKNHERDYEIKVRKTYRKALKGYVANMSSEKAEKLSKDPSVKYIEQDSETYSNQVTWGLDRIDQRALPLDGQYTADTTASNVHAYVLDSGILPTHVDFGGRATADFDAVPDGRNGIDCTGHGTHVAGTIGSATYGVAKGVRIHSVRVQPCSGTGQMSELIMGVDWVAQNRVLPAVANISITASGPSNALDSAIQATSSTGVTFVVAAGNYNMDACNYSPARSPIAITVGATTSSDLKASYSNFGQCVDIWAPGTSILSLAHTSDTGTRTMSGTSMASPHVAGVAALYLSKHPTATPAQVAASIYSSASTVTLDLNNRLLYSYVTSATAPTPTATPTATPAPTATPCQRYNRQGKCIK